jgi:hypothetical protein
MKPYEEISSAIDHSTNVKDLEICLKMLESNKEFISLEDYEALKQVINFKQKLIR